MERSPNKRVLPASAEPGVWAADGDPVLAGDKADRYTVSVLGVVLPSARAKSTAATRVCAHYMALATKDAPSVRPLSEPERRCLVARLLEHCLGASARSEKAALDRYEADSSDKFEDILSSYAKAQEFSSDACAGSVVTDAVKRAQAATSDVVVELVGGKQ